MFYTVSFNKAASSQNFDKLVAEQEITILQHVRVKAGSVAIITGLSCEELSEDPYLDTIAELPSRYAC